MSSQSICRSPASSPARRGSISRNIPSMTSGQPSRISDRVPSKSSKTCLTEGRGGKEGLNATLPAKELDIEKGLLHVLEEKRDSRAGSQAEAAVTRGRCADGNRQIDFLVLGKDQFALAAGWQAQRDLALAARALRVKVQRALHGECGDVEVGQIDRKSTRLNSSHLGTSYA